MIFTLLSSIVYLNFIYQLIYLFKGLSRQGYAEDTTHRFQCSRCNENYTLSGPEAKKHRWAPRIEKSTPFSQRTSYVFQCPHCNKRAAQLQIFDTNITKGLGSIRIQMNDKQKPLVVHFLDTTYNKNMRKDI